MDVLGLKDPRVTNPDYDDTTSDAISESKRLVSKFEQIFASKSTQYWFKKLRSHDIPCEPIRYVEEMIDDEQVLANKYVIEMNHHTGKKIRTSGPVVRFGDRMPEEIPSPALGQHTDDILVDVGFSKDQITKLHSDGSVA